MYKFQEILEATLLEILEDGNLEELSEAQETKIASMIPGLTDAVAEPMLETIKRNAASGLKVERQQQRQFEKRHRQRWRKPLDLLHLLISIAREAGTDFNSEFRNDAVRSGDALFEVLTRLHARACQVSLEILALLRSGYADGAHARWRSLHEISTVSCFIGQQGQQVAEKYLLHETVQRYKSACQYQKYAERINDEPFTDEEFNRIKSRRDKLVERFGKPFGSDYGWAASALSNDRPRMSDIEEHAELSHWKPYYRMASDNVHPNSHGSYYRLGLDPHADDVLLAGPSNFGLEVPGHSTAISLHQATAVLLTNRSNFDCIVVLKILEKLVDEIGEAFLEVHQELDGSVDESESQATN